MSRVHLLPIALAFVAGIASDIREIALQALAVGCVIAFVTRAAPGPIRANMLAAFALGMLDAHAFAHAAAPAGDSHIRRFSAVVLEAEPRPDGIGTLVRLADGSRALATLEGAPLLIGAHVALRGKRQPFDEPRNPGDASPRELEAERGVTWRIVHARLLARAPPDPRDPSLWMLRARAWASARLHATLEEPGATILAGALWGERGALSPELRAEFQDTGTVHILVTAGLHLGVVAALAVALLTLMGCGRVGAAVGSIAIIWAYAAFSGGHLPSVRAATMLSFALLARAAGRDSLSWNGLAAAAILVAATRPASVLSVSFGLSFSCVAAIFAFAKPLTKAFERAGIPHLASGTIAVAIAAQLGTWPLSAATFLVIAPYAPLANAAVVPVIGVAMLAGVVELVCAAVPLLATLTNNIVVSLLDWIVSGVSFVGSLPGAHVIATPPPSWALAVYSIALACAAAALSRGYIRVTVALIVGASALCLWPPRTANRELTITAIDVGQADALLIRTPAGHAYLVDAGGRLERGGSFANASSAEDVGERTVVPFLIRSGIHHLDAILLSHPHGDHAGGLAPVFRTLGANGFADSGQSYPGHAYHDALDIVRAEKIPMLEPRGGDVWRTSDGVTFRFYGPTQPYITGSRSDINSNSLVFRLEFGTFRMLFMGDAGRETEERLLGGHDDLHADVLKVGHHGSAYGTTAGFLQAVGPRDAIISVGRDNLFGHPAPATLRQLSDFGVTVYRTDHDGAVTVEVGDGRFAVRGYLASKP